MVMRRIKNFLNRFSNPNIIIISSVSDPEPDPDYEIIIILFSLSDSVKK